LLLLLLLLLFIEWHATVRVRENVLISKL